MPVVEALIAGLTHAFERSTKSHPSIGLCLELSHLGTSLLECSQVPPSLRLETYGRQQAQEKRRNPQQGDIMGLFGKKAKPSKSGSYSFAWPASSGLGPGFHAEYLTYSSDRRRREGIPPEDAHAMAEAREVLDRIGLQDELLLIVGDVDLRALDAPEGSDFRGVGAVTDRSTVFWWRGRRGFADEYVILPHQNLQPAVPGGFGYHFVWTQGGANDFPPVGAVDMLRPLSSPGFAVSPHFSADGQANRRGASVQETLFHVRGD